MLKLKMMLCVMMLPLVVVGCTSKQSVNQCVKPPPPPAWIMQPPRLADTAGWMVLSERLITMQKQLEGTQKYINEQCRCELPAYSGARSLQLLWRAIHTRFQRNIMPKVAIDNPFTNAAGGFCFNNIFCAATNFGCIDGFLLPNSRNEENDGDGFL